MRTTTIEAPFQLIDNRITKINVNNSLFSLNDESIKREIVDVDYNVLNIDENEDQFFGTLSVSVKVKAQQRSKKTKNESISISICVEGGFDSGKDKLSKEDFFKMLEISGTACLYSIARANIINISSQCLLHGQLRVPMINVFEYVKSKEVEYPSLSSEYAPQNKEGK